MEVEVRQKYETIHNLNVLTIEYTCSHQIEYTVNFYLIEGLNSNVL